MNFKSKKEMNIINESIERFGKIPIDNLIQALLDNQSSGEILGIERSVNSNDPVLISRTKINFYPNEYITIYLYNLKNSLISYAYIKIQDNSEKTIYIENIESNGQKRMGYGDLLIKYIKILANEFGSKSIAGHVPFEYTKNQKEPRKLETFYYKNNMIIDKQNNFYLNLKNDNQKYLNNEGAFFNQINMVSSSYSKNSVSKKKKSIFKRIINKLKNGN